MATLEGQMGTAARALGWACLLLSLLSQLPLDTQGICYFHAQAPCLYKGKPFAPGESWRGANCSKCFCLEPLGVGCCDMMQFPVDFPEGCEVHYDSEACQVSLVQKDRPSSPCANSLETGWGLGQPPRATAATPAAATGTPWQGSPQNSTGQMELQQRRRRRERG